MTDSSSSENTTSWFKQLQMLFLALFVGQIMFGLVVFFLYDGDRVFNLEAGGFLLWVGLFVFLINMLLAFFYYSSSIKRVKKIQEIKDRMADFRKISIVRFAFIEASTLLCLVLFLQSGNLILFTLAVLSMLTFLILRPTKSQILSDLDKDDLVKNYLDA